MTYTFLWIYVLCFIGFLCCIPRILAWKVNKITIKYEGHNAIFVKNRSGDDEKDLLELKAASQKHYGDFDPTGAPLAKS